MKKAILIVMICFTGHVCLAQLIGNLVVVQQPPGSILNWSQKDLTYIVNNQSGQPRRAVVKSVLTLADGTPVATTNLALAKMFNFGGGTTLLYAPDVIPLEAMVFVGKFKLSLEKTGKLPAGTYQLCVQLVTPVDFIPLSEERCRIFTLASFQLPIPMMPANEEVIEAEKAQTAITFRWTPVSPRPAELIKYVVTIFEILDKQTPMQALRSNQPLLTKEIVGTTQYIWQPQISFIKTKIWTDDTAGSYLNKDKPKPGDKPVTHVSGDPHADRIVRDSIDASSFIWTIQTLDARGVPFGDGNINGDGISEPNVFTVIKDRRKNRSGVPAKVLYMDYINNKVN